MYINSVHRSRAIRAPAIATPAHTHKKRSHLAVTIEIKSLHIESSIIICLIIAFNRSAIRSNFNVVKIDEAHSQISIVRVKYNGFLLLVFWQVSVRKTPINLVFSTTLVYCATVTFNIAYRSLYSIIALIVSCRVHNRDALFKIAAI